MKKILGLFLGIFLFLSFPAFSYTTVTLADAQDDTGDSAVVLSLGDYENLGCDVDITGTATVHLEGRIGGADFRTLVGTEATASSKSFTIPYAMNDIKSVVDTCTECEVTVHCTWW